MPPDNFNVDTPVSPLEAEDVLSVERLFVDFPTESALVHAVRDSTFKLKKGRTLAIVGESGSGKSVSCYAVLRILQDPGRIVSGSIHFHSKRKGRTIDIAKLEADDPQLFDLRGGSISLIFQEPQTALSPLHTIGNQIVEAVRLHQDVTKKEARERAIEILRTVGMPKPEQRIDQYPHEISGGMRQRVVIAMALVCRPEILIADEPTTALDVTVQAQILDLIRELKEKFGTSVIFITHDLGVVAQIADDVVVMNKGRIVEKGTVYQIFEEPLHPYTCGLMRAMPRLDQKTDKLAGVDVESDDPEWVPEGESLSPPDVSWWSPTGNPPAEPRMHALDDTRSVLLWPLGATTASHD